MRVTPATSKWTPEYLLEYNRKRVTLEKTRAMMFLGGVCAHCGNNDSRVLQIDHVHGDGYAERKLMRNPSQKAAAIFRSVGKYQILCANCNWIKRFDHSETRGRTRTVTGEN